MLNLLKQLSLGFIAQVKVVAKGSHDDNWVLSFVDSDLFTILAIELYVQDAYRLLVSECALVLIVKTDFGSVHLLR